MALSKTNISTSLVGSTLGTGSRDVGTLCTYSSINKWSKYKPVDNREPSYAFESGWWKGRNLSGGLSVETADTFQGLRALSGQGKGWDYTERPKGGADSPYRLGDFRMYDHEAQPPTSIYMPNNYSYYGGGNDFVWATVFVKNEPTWLSLSDIAPVGINNSLGEWFSGFIYESNPKGVIGIITSISPIKKAVYNETIRIVIDSGFVGPIILYPILSNIPYEFQKRTLEAGTLLIPMPNTHVKVSTVYKAGNVTITINKSKSAIRSVGNGKYTFNIVMDVTSSSLTYFNGEWWYTPCDDRGWISGEAKKDPKGKQYYQVDSGTPSLTFQGTELYFPNSPQFFIVEFRGTSIGFAERLMVKL